MGIANPFQQLASDVQALLVQAQGGTAPTTATSATGTTTGAGPEQQVATDLQTLMAQLQAGHTGSDPNAQAGTTGQTGATEPGTAASSPPSPRWRYGSGHGCGHANRGNIRILGHDSIGCHIGRHCCVRQ